MNATRLGLAMALVMALGAVAAIAGPAAVVTTLGMPRHGEVEAATLADMDGDGHDDLVVAASGQGHFRRTLRVHLRRKGPVTFATEPDHLISLTRDVVAFSIGDVHEAAGREIVLLTATGAFALRPGAGEEERPRRLIATSFLWQLPHYDEVFFWSEGVSDMNGDGLDDLLLPEPGGYRIALQSRGEDGLPSFERERLLETPAEHGRAHRRAGRHAGQERWKKIQVDLSLGVSDRDSDGSAISVWDAVPMPTLLDFDGDGRVDIFAQTSEELIVWRQNPARDFAPAPSLRLQFPLELDRSRVLDLSFGSHAADLNGDGRADCVVLAGDRRSDEPRTQVLVYVQGAGRGRGAQTPEAPLFGPRGVPQQLLVVGGFAGGTDLVDVDGNGLPDLVLGTLRIDAVDAIRAASSGEIEVSLYVYLNSRGRFSKQPDLVQTVPLPTEDLSQAGRRLAARFVGDLNGDRTSDLLLRDDPERLRVLAVRRAGRKLTVQPDPIYETRIEERARIRVSQGASGAPPEILVLEGKQVQHVRFR